MREGGVKHEGGLFEKHDGFRGFLEGLPKPSNPSLRWFIEFLEKYAWGGDRRVAEAAIEIACERHERLVRSGKLTVQDAVMFDQIFKRYKYLYELSGWTGWDEQSKEFYKAWKVNSMMDAYPDAAFWTAADEYFKSVAAKGLEFAGYVRKVVIDKLI